MTSQKLRTSRGGGSKFLNILRTYFLDGPLCLIYMQLSIFFVAVQLNFGQFSYIYRDKFGYVSVSLNNFNCVFMQMVCKSTRIYEVYV